MKVKNYKTCYTPFKSKQLMRILATLCMITVLVMSGCSSRPRTAEEAQVDPATTAETIFYLIQNEKFDALPALIADDADEKSKEFGTMKDLDDVKKGQTVEYFKSASLNGEPIIDGD